MSGGDTDAGYAAYRARVRHTKIATGRRPARILTEAEYIARVAHLTVAGTGARPLVAAAAAATVAAAEATVATTAATVATTSATAAAAATGGGNDTASDSDDGTVVAMGFPARRRRRRRRRRRHVAGAATVAVAAEAYHHHHNHPHPHPHGTVYACAPASSAPAARVPRMACANMTSGVRAYATGATRAAPSPAVEIGAIA
jgi:hypothetical protein